MKNSEISAHTIQNAIYLIRGEKVIMDRDLAAMYGVPTKALKQAVKRNAGRFPDDFMFVLTREEFADWRSQIVTSNADRMGLRHAPMAFTEQGVAMLSSVLNSEKAVRVNIAIIRAFVRLREILATNRGLAEKFAELERKLEGHDESIQNLFEAIRQLLAPPDSNPRKIGFDVKQAKVSYRVRPKPAG